MFWETTLHLGLGDRSMAKSHCSDTTRAPALPWPSDVESPGPRWAEGRIDLTVLPLPSTGLDGSPRSSPRSRLFALRPIVRSQGTLPVKGRLQSHPALCFCYFLRESPGVSHAQGITLENTALTLSFILVGGGLGSPQGQGLQWASLCRPPPPPPHSVEPCSGSLREVTLSE